MTPSPASPAAGPAARSPYLPALVGAGVTFLVLLALLAAYAVGSARDRDALVLSAAADTQQTGALGTITMTGTGEAVGVPDQLRFTLAVTHKEAGVATAMDSTSETLRRSLAALAEHGVERKDTQSTGLSIDPEYAYPNAGPPVLTGYRVRQSVSVVVRDLREAGKAIAAAVEAGGNAVRVSGIGLRVGDQDALLEQARADALAAATAKAQQYADAGGQVLGRVLTVKEGTTPGRPQQLYSQGVELADASRVAALPIRAGRDTLSVKVAVVWSLDGE